MNRKCIGEGYLTWDPKYSLPCSVSLSAVPQGRDTYLNSICLQLINIPINQPVRLFIEWEENDDE